MVERWQLSSSFSLPSILQSPLLTLSNNNNNNINNVDNINNNINVCNRNNNNNVNNNNDNNKKNVNNKDNLSGKNNKNTFITTNNNSNNTNDRNTNNTNNNKYVVNYDERLSVMMEESRHFITLGLHVPELQKNISLQVAGWVGVDWRFELGGLVGLNWDVGFVGLEGWLRRLSGLKKEIENGLKISWVDVWGIG